MFPEAVQAHLDALAVDPGCEAVLQGERFVYCVTGGCWDLVIHIYMHVYTRAPVQAHLDAPAVGPGCEAALQGERSVYCVKGGCWDLVIHRDIRMHMHT